MELYEIETWALRVVNRIKVRQPVEDSLVELKSEWIPPEKAARRIAGHANSVQGSNILWLIGVDEEKGVVGVEANELSNWYNGVKSQFDGSVPALLSVNIQLTDKTIVAVLFETKGAPYVVKNPAFGKEKGNPVQFEVPWREGTSVRSASRTELLKILTPISKQPKFEVTGGIFKAKIMEKKDWDESPGKFQWELRLFLYIEPITSDRVVIPFHRCEGTFSFSNYEKKYRFRWVDLKPGEIGWVQKTKTGIPVNSHTEKLSKTIDNTVDELLIDGPGKCFLDAYAFTMPTKIDHPEKVFIELILRVTNDDIGTPVQVTLPRFDSVSSESLYYFYWIKNPPKETDEILE